MNENSEASRQHGPKVLMVAEAIGDDLFGVSGAIMRLIKTLDVGNIDCRTMVTKKHHISDVAIDAEVETLPTLPLAGRSTTTSRMMRWHPLMMRRISDLITSWDPDIVHVHGVYTPLQRAAIRAAHTNGKFTVLSPHGMIEPWTWGPPGSLYSVSKRLLWRSLIRPTLRVVDIIHAITSREAATLQREFPNVRQVLIPNAIALDEVPSGRAGYLENLPERRIVFLGRIHPVKGIDLLLHAFAAAKLASKWRLEIVGPDSDPEYARSLRKLSRSLEIDDVVAFIGSLRGNLKFEHLASAWVVAVPSYSEVVGLVNLEAAAVRTPSITTVGTGLDNWAQSGGILIRADVRELTSALQVVAGWSPEERLARGRQARRFVADHYSWDVVGPKWLKFYSEMSRHPGE